MEDRHDRVSALAREGACDVVDPRLVTQIEVRGGLVEKKDLRLLGKGTRQQHALALAAGEPIEPTALDLGHLESGHRLARDREVPRARKGERGEVRRATHQDDLERREREVDGGVLGDDGEPARNLAPSVGREGSPREPDGARARREDPRQEPDERRLAASVRTDHAEDLPGQEREADRAENLARAVAERDRVRLEERGHPSARRRSRCRR